ncbi:uncharacterized protein [Amphiura filiformis]|uniref:uncharacterized protein n=1 Tax=Amphiura filiformis TaxID=82378 RepID=UPI003B2149C9
MQIVDGGEANDIMLTLDQSYIVENSPANAIIGTLRAQSPSHPSNTYTFSLPDIYQEQFNLRSRQGEDDAVDLIARWQFDYESDSTHDVVVEAVSENETAVQHFTVTVMNVNEPAKNITLTAITVPENKVGVLAGVISAIDPEADDMDFDIISDPANAFQLTQFDISNARKLITTRELNYETEPRLTITIGVTDTMGSAQSITRTFEITVANVNEAPSRIQPIRFEVEENTVAMTTIGSLSVTDVDDAHTPQKFDCQMKDDGGGMFTMFGTDVKVASGAALDYESFPVSMKTVAISVECYDQGQLSVTTDIDVVITDVNEAPTDIISQSGVFEIQENNNGGATVATLLTLDPESPDPSAGTFTYSTLEAPLDFPFAIIGDRIIAHQSLNYEDTKAYDMHITTTDQGGMTLTKTIRINVLDGNDAPTSIIMATTAKIFEHSPPSTPICTLTAIDEDINQEHYFMIETQTPEGALQIFNGTELLVGNTDIDFETWNTVSVTLTVRDIGATQSGMYVETFTLDVEDVNEPPTGIRLSASTIVENPDFGTDIALVIVEDPDTFEQTFYCYLVYEGTNNFQLMQQDDGIHLKVGHETSSFNYEQAKSVEVSMWCRDSDPQFVQATFTIQIQDANDPPTGLVFLDAEERTATTNASQPVGPDMIGSVVTSQTVTIQEDAPISVGVVCYIFVIDEDAFSGAEPAHQSAVVELISQDEYEQIMESSGDTRRRRSDRIYSRHRRQATEESWEISDDFVIQSGTNYLLVNDKLDHETRAEYMVYFKAYDPDMTDEVVVSSLRVVVLDVDEAPQDMMITSTVVEENSPVNTIIGDLSVFDPDGTQTGFMYTMISLGTPFFIIGTSLHVERHPLDYEVTPAISIQIQVQEIASSLVLTKTFHINVTDIPEPPTSLTVDGNITIWVAETIKAPTSLGTILSDDPDHFDGGMTYTFFKQQPVEFQIEVDQLMLVASLDSWQRRLFDLPMQVADSTGLTFRQVIFVRVMEEDRCSDEGYCSPHATCVHNQCQCKPGFVGDGFNSCLDHNECVPNPCDTKNSYGACENGIGGLRNFTCKCRPGWTGPECINRVNQCNNNQCHEQGTLECRNLDSSYTCICKDGFTGTYCDDNIDECVDHQCQNNGVCVDGINGYTCDCTPPFVGPFCETNSDLCQNIICPYNGTCLPVPNQSNTVCRCLEPYAADCQGCAYGYGEPDCSPCQPPYTESYAADCQGCAYGYGGPDCSPCQPPYTEPYAADCQGCAYGYGGPDCSPCQPPYTEPYAADCQGCAYGYGGPDCSPCQPPYTGRQQSATLSGSCLLIPNQSNTVCRCLEPYAADCQGCAYGYGEPDCTPCQPPYTGANCEVDSSVCYPNPCDGNKICVPYYEQFACICPANDTDSKCSGSITPVIHDNQISWIQTTGGLTSLVVAAVALLAVIVLLLALMYCRKLRHKSSKPWGRARFNSESQQVIIEAQENGGITDDISWPSQYPATNIPSVSRQRNPRNNIVSVKVSNDLRETRNPSRMDNGDPVANFVGAIAKPLSSRGRQISSAKKNNLGEWEKGAVAHKGDENFDSLKKQKGENIYVDMPQRELPVGAVVFRNDQYNPVSPRQNLNPSPSRQSPRRHASNHGDDGIEEDIVSDNRHMQESRQDGRSRIDSLKDNPVFQGSDDEEEEVPTSII